MPATYLPPLPAEPHARELRIVDDPSDRHRKLLVTGCGLSRPAFNRLAKVRSATLLIRRDYLTLDGEPLTDFTIRIAAHAETDALAAMGYGRNFRVDAAHDELPDQHRRDRDHAQARPPRRMEASR